MINGFNTPMGVKQQQQQQQQGLFTSHQHQLSQQTSGSNTNTGTNLTHQQNQYQNQPPQSTSSPPAMGSPYRSATRKLGGDIGGPGGMKIPMGMGMSGPASPRMGGGLGLGGPANGVGPGGLGLGAGIMGPPGLPRSISGDAMNMMNANNANPNASNNNMINGQQRQSPRPQSSMGTNADMPSRLGIPPGPQQRQGSMPPQFSNPQQQQQQMRQGSLPPGPGQQQLRQKMGQDGMNMNIGGGGMGVNMGGGMGMGMKPNNEMHASMPSISTTPMNMSMGMGGMNPMGGMGNMGGVNPGMNNMGGMNPMNMNMNIPPAPHSASSTSSAPHTPASPLLGGGGPGTQGLVPSLSVSSVGSTGGQTAMPSIQQTPSMGPAPVSSSSNSGPITASAALGTSSTPLASATASTSAAATVGAPPNTSSLPTLPPLKPSTTHITTIPLSTSHLHIPALTSPEIIKIQGWMKKDQEYEVLVGKSRERMVEEVREALGSGSGGAIRGMATPGWWEMPGTGNFNRWRRRGEMFEVRYPKTKRDREREREREGRGKKSVRREGLKLYVAYLFALCRSFRFGVTD